MGVGLSLLQFPAKKLNEYLNNPELFIKDLGKLENGKVKKSCDLGKAFDAIYYLLNNKKFDGYAATGKLRINEPPLSLVIYSDQLISKDQDLGMGPASYLYPDQIKEINKQLSVIDITFLKNIYDPQKMNRMKIYPTFWNEDLFKYIEYTFAEMKNFYNHASQKGNAVASYFG